MIDNKTQRLALPLPNVDNYLEDDVSRLAEALQILDANVATVDESGKIPMSQIPAVALTDAFPVDDQAAMLALNAQPGDVAIRNDLSKSFILMAAPATTLGNWKEIVNDALVQLGKSTGGQLVFLLSGMPVQQAIDHLYQNGRRASDFASIQAALATGLDVEVDANISSSTRIDLGKEQALIGRGGAITITAPATPAVFADARSTGQNRDDVRLQDVNVTGSVTAEGGAAYAVFLRDMERAVIDGLKVSGFTGGVIDINTVGSIIRNVFVKNSVYHPALVAGGYGVLLDETREAIIDGIQFYAGAGNDGRHALYISRSGGHGNAYDGCRNTIAGTIIAKYTDKNDRNFWTVNVRKCIRGILRDIVSDGSNGGISYNVENGDIERHITSRINLKVLKYQDGVGVYGISQTYPNSGPNYRYNGWLDDSLMLEVKPKDATVSGADCIGYNIAGTNGRLSNVVTNVSTLGNPILVQPGSKNVLIDGVLDFMDDGVAGTPGAFITFTGLAETCENISVRGCKTSRPMFNRLSAVKDLTVDFTRQARVNISGGAAAIANDSSYQLIKNVTLSATGIDIALNSHVTQAAADAANVRMALDPGTEGYVLLRNTGGKNLNVRFYSTTGALLNPTTATVSCIVTLYS